ncbi:unnamed protein product [Cylicocyclus nassatus]|uniref:Uncharacterized protein n=1 Tax=Cylicocyclus nassatus TaxID=53992 RepID=A0AA36M822_CYLNA|nr:unnamed protein product [Cylicocyclus nassatus]
MAATVRTFKGLVTKRTQAISTWLKENSALLSNPCDSESARKERIHDAYVALKECDEHITLLETSMAKLANAYDEYEDHSVEDDEQLSKYTDAAQEVIMNLHDHKSKLRRVLYDYTAENDNESENSQAPSKQGPQRPPKETHEHQRAKMPAIKTSTQRPMKGTRNTNQHVITSEEIEEENHNEEEKQTTNQLTVNNEAVVLQTNKWEFTSNDETFNSSIKPDDRMKNRYPRVLGVSWRPHTDDIVLASTIIPQRNITKRRVTQELASIYDPMGLLVPILLPAKVFLQSLWKDDYPWDDTLPENLRVQWYYLTEGITMFYKEIKRQILPSSKNYRLIVFTDASQCAIATCIYLDNYEATNLLMAKSKLHSLKASITIPKSEMNAVVLGARVARYAYNSLASVIQIDEIIFLTDSEIVLGWIKSHSKRSTAGVLVKNRLKELKNIVKDVEKQKTSCLFGHVSTQDNLADCGTRGLMPNTLKNHLWWGGAELTDRLKKLQRSELFSLSTINEEDPVLPVQLNAIIANEVEEKTLFTLTRYSSLFKAQRVVAYVMRFLRRVTQHFQQERKEEVHDHIPAIQFAATTFELTGVELREARLCIIRDHQKHMVTEHQINSQKDLNIRTDEKGTRRSSNNTSKEDSSDNPKPDLHPNFDVLPGH